VGGNPAIGTVTLSRPAPSGGAVVALSTPLPDVAILPAAVTVRAGATSATFAITTTVVAETFHVNIFADLQGTDRQALLVVTPGGTPPGPVPAAPTLVSPANGSRPAQPVTFQWSNVANAGRYEIQIDDSSAFAAPLVLSRTVTASQFTAGTLPVRRLWWRVRAISAEGIAGPFSAVRRVEPRR
jgi:hypothetical protein